MKHLPNLLFLVLIILSCEPDNEKALASFEVFCEMVANDAKPIALGHPMEKADLDEVWKRYQVIAEAYDVSLFRELEFPVTPLFPASVTLGKEVVIIYRGSRLVQYQQFKEDLAGLKPEVAGRRFGRLLGYTSQGINELLMQNTEFRTLSSFGVNQQITHLYYQNLDMAHHFYRTILGLSLVDGIGYQLGEDVFIQLHEHNDRHPENQPKSTAIAFLTNQLPGWYQHVQEQSVPIKYSYKPRDGGPHDGFVAIDPGGYLLEFEQFKQHPENELFMAELEDAPKMMTQIDSLSFLGSITWTYHNDLLKMQRFYEEVLGYRMVADQGWTKIYQTSAAGFIGLVDERRGMMDYAEAKAVELEWGLERAEEARDYFSPRDGWQEDIVGLIGPERYVYLLR